MPDIQLNVLGETGLYVSEIALGTVKFGRNTGVKYPKDFIIPDSRTLQKLLQVTASLGINYLDTAPAYGSSEETLGKLLKERKDQWIISTKVGEYFTGNQSSYDFSRQTTVSSVESSLRKLGVDTLDIVFVHSNGEDEFVITQTEVLPTLQALKQKGLIRSIGFSGKSAQGSAHALDLCDVFMITLNEADLSQTPLIDQCRKLNKGVVIKKALASGHSTNPTEALRFVNHFPGVSSTIVGTITEDHLRQNVQAITSA